MKILSTVFMLLLSFFAGAQSHKTFTGETIDLSTLRINGQLSFFESKANLYITLGKPDSIVFKGVGPYDSLIVFYFGNLTYIKWNDSLAFHEFNIDRPSLNHITINNKELNQNQTLNQIEKIFANEGLGDVNDSLMLSKKTVYLWCPLINVGFADKLKFIFEYDHLVRIETFIDV